MINDLLESELSLNREAGTYLFYGRDQERIFSIAKKFAASIFMRNEIDKDFDIERKVQEEVYTDLHIIENLTISVVRELIKNTYTSSHEGKAKVFILKNIQDMRKESANALLKVIEEPTKNNFFILLSNKLSILPTIKSRSIIFKVENLSHEDLEVDKYVYDFYRGISTDIERYKENKIDLKLEASYKDVGFILKQYEEEDNIENLTNLYKCLRDFIKVSSRLKTYQKIEFAENLYRNVNNKSNIPLILDYLIFLVRMDKNLKEKLELKKMLRYPINMKLFLNNFILML